MGRQIVKQPDGRFSIWSSIVDNFIITDCTKEEYIEMRIKEETEKIKKDLNEIFDNIENGKNSYFQFTKTYDECIEIIKADDED